MKKTIVTIAALSLASAASADIEVPYYGKLKNEEVCGKKDCQPGGSTLYTFFKTPIDYDGDPTSFLGQKYKKIYERDRCVSVDIKPENLDVFGAAEIKGQVKETEAKKLSGKVEADLKKLVDKIIAPLPADLQAKAAAEMNNSITTDAVRNVTLEYQRINLNQKFLSENISSCVKSATNREMVVTGIAIVRVSGSWTKNKLRDVFNKIDGGIGYQTFANAEAKKEYDANKASALSGSFAPASYVIATAWRKGTAKP